MKIFISGGTGFIGTHLVRCLAQTEHELVCLARKTSDISTLKEVGATVVVGDVTDKGSLLAGMQGCDWVVNLANLFLFWVPDERVYSDVNIQGTRNVMESALEAGVSKVVHVSTAAVWGKAAWPISEQTPMGAQRASQYARTKYEGDQIAWRLHKERGLPLVVVYPSAVIGAYDPKATGRYIKNLVRRKMPAQVLTDAPFSFVYVGDVCTAILGALQKDGNIGEKYLVSGANLSFGEINRLVSEVAGVRLPIFRLPDALTAFNARFLTGLSNLTRRPPWLDLSVDQVSLMRQGFKVDGSKAARELGFRYTPIRTALEEAIASF
ncbi:MAG: NAD-dependent epimerase/dehydratase family protein [Anaerolineales bacterium]|nr:NAD-dependent epimerase/dehydratase family protein [Anaerolineales bacterium]